MCRFLLIKSENQVDPQKYLQAFSDMAEKSKAFDGDWQGDGWGVSWLDENDKWQIYRSLKPVWQDTEKFKEIPFSRIIAVHARSASFPEHKNIIQYNQPYISGQYSFVFNGLLKGVKLSSDLPGTIGAEKIWSLLQTFLKRYDPQTSLEKVKHVLIKNAREIQALNIGLSDGQSIYSLNYFTKHPHYYQLYLSSSNNVSLICSEDLKI